MQIVVSVLTALAITAGLITLFNFLLVAPWQILLLLLAVVWFYIEYALRQCRKPFDLDEAVDNHVLTYRGANYLRGQLGNASLTPAEQDLVYRGRSYKVFDSLAIEQQNLTQAEAEGTYRGCKAKFPVFTKTMRNSLMLIPRQADSTR